MMGSQSRRKLWESLPEPDDLRGSLCSFPLGACAARALLKSEEGGLVETSGLLGMERLLDGELIRSCFQGESGTALPPVPGLRGMCLLPVPSDLLKIGGSIIAGGLR